MNKGWFWALTFGMLAGDASAAGFALIEQNADGLGLAYAGGAASADNASAVFFNPAGLTRLQGNQWTGALHLILPSAKFANQGSKAAGGAPLGGGNGGDAGVPAAIPNFYLAHDIDERTKFGFGVNVPFGLSTDYESNWVGRYHALKSEVQVVNLNPSLAYRVNDAWSIGGGIDVQYAKAELSNAIDFGTVCMGALGAKLCAPLGLLPQAADGKATVTGDSWGFGYNLGVMAAPRPDTRFGLAYRSRVDHQLNGDARYDKPAAVPAALANSPVFSNAGAKADLNLPGSLSLSVFHQATTRLALMADVTRTYWSRFKELRVRFDNGAPDSVIPENWRDVNRVALGAAYRYDDAWTLRAGTAFDQSPVSDPDRTPRLPDADRIWLGIGVKYQSSKNTGLDIGYAHIFMKEATLNQLSPVRGNLVGSSDNQTNILSLQYTQAF